MFQTTYYEILKCPVCSSDLKIYRDSILCKDCCNDYKVLNGIPLLVDEGVSVTAKLK